MAVIEIGENLKKTIRNIAILFLIGWLAYVLKDGLILIVLLIIVIIFSGKEE